MGLSNGDFEQGLTGWTPVDGGCDNQAFTLDSTPGDPHAGTNCLKATSRFRATGPETWCGFLRATLTSLVPGNPNHDVAGFWKSIQRQGSDSGRVIFRVDGSQVGEFNAVQGSYTTFVFPFTPMATTALLEMECEVAPGPSGNWRDYLFDDLVLGTDALPSKARLVRQALIAKIRSATGVASATQSKKVWTEETNFPAIYVRVRRTTKVRAPTRSKECVGTYLATCRLKTDAAEDDFDELVANIENAVEFDPTLGGLCMDTNVSVLDAPAFEGQPGAAQTYDGTILIEATYRHPRAAA